MKNSKNGTSSNTAEGENKLEKALHRMALIEIWSPKVLWRHNVFSAKHTSLPLWKETTQLYLFIQNTTRFCYLLLRSPVWSTETARLPSDIPTQELSGFNRSIICPASAAWLRSSPLSGNLVAWTPIQLYFLHWPEELMPNSCV